METNMEVTPACLGFGYLLQQIAEAIGGMIKRVIDAPYKLKGATPPASFAVCEPRVFEHAVTKKVKGADVVVRFYSDGHIEGYARLGATLSKRNHGNVRLSLEVECGRTEEETLARAVAAFEAVARLDDGAAAKSKKPTQPTQTVLPVPVPPPVLGNAEEQAEKKPGKKFAEDSKIRVREVADVEVLEEVEGELLQHGVGDQRDHRDQDKMYRCYYADVFTSKGVKRLLGKDLERAIVDAKAKIGDQVRLKKTGVEYFDAAGGKDAKGKRRRKNYWSAEVLA